MGTDVVHLSIHAITLVDVAKFRGRRAHCLLHHPEDLGKTYRGSPASIWQVIELRKTGNESTFVTQDCYRTLGSLHPSAMWAGLSLKLESGTGVLYLMIVVITTVRGSSADKGEGKGRLSEPHLQLPTLKACASTLPKRCSQTG